nr:RNA-directed DNA polymerase, eukaryota, reverse transcriptase zinc-binding domain protein [Tanacetum cinerariifolium]
MENIVVGYFLDSQNFGSRKEDTPVVIDKLVQVTFAFQKEDTVARKNLSFVNLGLSGWKANLSSIGGRLTLIKYVFGSLGGLCVGSLSAFNKALLLKWTWRLINFPNSLWVQLKMVLLSAFERILSLEIILFISDIIDYSTLKTIKIASLVNVFLMVHGNGIGVGLLLWEDPRPNLITLSSTFLTESDTYVWSLSNYDSFAVNSVRKHIDEHSLPSLFPCTRWYKMISKM